MAVKKKKETTIDDLALMIGKGFQQVDERFKQISEDSNGRFKQINERLDKVEEQLASLEVGQDDMRNKLDNAAYRFELVDLEKRVRILERKVK